MKSINTQTINTRKRVTASFLATALIVALLTGCSTTPLRSSSLIQQFDISTAHDNESESEFRPPELVITDYWNTDRSSPDNEHQTLSHNETLTRNKLFILQSAQQADIENTLYPFQQAEPAPIVSDEILVLNPPDLWNRIRSQFSLIDTSHPRTRAEIAWYSRHQNYLNRTVDRARPYLYLIMEEIEKRNIPAEIALLPVVESAFQPFAYSHGRAAGIWQFIPSTGKLYGLKQNWWYDGRRDIYAATVAALDHLVDLNRSFKGDWLLALAAYNSGPGTVKRAIRKNKRKGKPTDFWSLDLPRETRGYVPKLLAISALVADPDKYGVNIKHVNDLPFLEKVGIGSQIDLALAADLAGLSIREMYRYNPAFNRWATAPQGPHYLLLPVTRAEMFQRELAKLSPSKRIHWARHKVRNGESLSQIAEKYRTTVKLLKTTNKIRGTMIRAGHNLIIPVSARTLDNYTLSSTQRLKAIQNRPNGRYKVTYRVDKGDTLWDISRKYNVRVAKLAKWNGMAPRDTLHLRQKLIIWQKNKGTGSNSSRANPNAALQKIRYKVRNGDSLARISQKFRVKISQLRKWNTLPRDKYLQPGQVLTLFIDVTRQSG